MAMTERNSSDSNITQLESPSEDDLANAPIKLKEILDGHMKVSEICAYLGRNKPFHSEVLRLYLQTFDLAGMGVEQAFRFFLSKIALSGETQEIDRVMVQFSKRFQENNPQEFANWTVVHTIVSSILILNTDLHSGMVEKKMSKKDFIDNTNLALQENERVPGDLLKSIYNSIKSNEIQLVMDEDEKRRTSATLFRKFSQKKIPKSPSMGLASNLPRNSSSLSLASRKSLEGEMPLNEDVIREGLLIRKNVMDSTEVRSSNRQWKAFFIVATKELLYTYKADPNGAITKDKKLVDVIHLRHSLASVIQGYSEDRPYVFSLKTHLGSVVYFQCPSEASLYSWINAINYVNARYSAPALASAVGSSRGDFVPPILPSSTTQNSKEKQIEYFRSQITKLDQDIFEHVAYRDEVMAKSKERGAQGLRDITNWDKKMYYLNGELKRYHEYINNLEKGLEEPNHQSEPTPHLVFS